MPIEVVMPIKALERADGLAIEAPDLMAKNASAAAAMEEKRKSFWTSKAADCPNPIQKLD